MCSLFSNLRIKWLALQKAELICDFFDGQRGLGQRVFRLHNTPWT